MLGPTRPGGREFDPWVRRARCSRPCDTALGLLVGDHRPESRRGTRDREDRGLPSSPGLANKFTKNALIPKNHLVHGVEGLNSPPSPQPHFA